ncbi:glycosyltransferase WbuB [Nonlabens spongiae]|uniref:Glycosyltransferase WbuB n=1 Tax=Nonlabens spongiae TaxID=331648 RepID=A0A1W6ML95_9FLAO|nr:glycosyltransferase family 4 protein [Nonlabens spongiae]ARN78378.1 glycosyltransferase WbuB [Nonlabens spongiae]
MERREILIISNYYPPESGAAANRIQTLAQSLRDHGIDTQIVCPLPNYPTGQVFREFRGKLCTKTTEDSITVNRLWLWPSKSENKLVRLFSMLSFALSLSLYLIFSKTPKKVIIQYSPVFVGFAGVFWCWILGKRIILNVSDLWPLAGLEMGLLNKGTYYTLLEKMESFCYQKSDLILGQSEEILEHVKKQTKEKELFLYRNYPTFAPPQPVDKPIKKPIKIVYAGLVGVAQGLSKIFSQITIPDHVEFHIYGDGPDMSSLENLKKTQITFHGSVSRDVLHQELQNYDLAFVPLITRIYGSVPSKIFEYSRLGLPLLYMGGGEGGDVVKNNEIGWVIEVGNYKQLERFLEQLDQKSFEGMAKSQIQKRAVGSFDFNDQFKNLVEKL